MSSQPLYSSTSSSSSSLAASSAMEIPPRSSRHPVNRILDSSDPFVGSPDNLLAPQRQHARPLSPANTLRATRPPIGYRSISSPQPSPIPGRQRAKSSLGRIPSALNLTNEPLTPQSEEQWTLFGQLMENEGQLRSPRSASRSGRRTPGASPLRRRTAPRSVSSRISSRGSIASFLEPFITVVSPVQEEPVTTFAEIAPHEEPDHTEVESSSDDGGYNSSDSEDSVYTPPTPSSYASAHPVRSRILRLSEVPLVYRNILKCAIAYFIGSLFTYNPYLSQLLADITSALSGGERAGTPHPSGHLVATVSVYFHPARTMGAMYEADLFFFIGVFYSAFVCLFAMSVFLWLELQQGWEWFGDAFVIVWIAMSFTGLAWMKGWMANPQFNTVCSMISVIIFVVLIKEGGLPGLLETTLIVSLGCTVSNLVCFFVWPQTATANLQVNMTKTLDSFSTILRLLTNTFLLEEGAYQPSLEKIQKAIENHQNSFTSLKNNLKEAKREWAFLPSGSPTTATGSESHTASAKEHQRNIAYEDAVDSLNRLGQHLNGLRGGTRLQFELAKAGVTSIRKKKKKTLVVDESQDDDEESALLKAAAVMFGDLVEELGPPLKALSSTCTSSIKRLKESFIHSREFNPSSKNAMEPHEFYELVEGINGSLLRFESTSNHAVLRLYRQSQAISLAHSQSHNSDKRSTFSGMGADTSENPLTNPENEHIFLVYFFIFTLQEFARELVFLVDAMERVYTIEQRRRTWKTWANRTWESLISMFTVKSSGPGKRKGLQRKLSSYIIPTESRHQRPKFPKVKPHAPDTLQTPSRKDLPFIGRIKQTLWLMSKRFSERDLKFAVKVGVSASILASPAFFDSTREFFVKNNGDWALISFFVVMSPTIGGTNALSFQRILGTLCGAVVASTIYSIFPENPTILSVFGFFFSLPCFYYIVTQPMYAVAGRFVLLTYNLTALYCYNFREDDLAVTFIALHRAGAVTFGVLWAAFISRFWWPSEARREMSKALSELCLNLGWLYTRLVASNSFAPEFNEDPDDVSRGGSSELSQARTTRLNNSIHEFMAMELHLQIKLIEIQGLLQQTQHEPRLKGPFPVQLYRGILTSLQTILDKLHSMRCVTTKEEWYTSVRKDFIIPVNKERHEMVGNVILYFSTLASAFRLKAPLPPYLPPAEKSRQRLTEAIRQLDVVRNREVKGSRQLLFFAYALTMKGVTEELESLGHTLQDAFGVIGQSPEEFDALFMDPAEARARLDWAA